MIYAAILLAIFSGWFLGRFCRHTALMKLLLRTVAVYVLEKCPIAEVNSAQEVVEEKNFDEDVVNQEQDVADEKAIIENGCDETDSEKQDTPWEYGDVYKECDDLLVKIQKLSDEMLTSHQRSSRSNVWRDDDNWIQEMRSIIDKSQLLIKEFEKCKIGVYLKTLHSMETNINELEESIAENKKTETTEKIREGKGKHAADKEWKCFKWICRRKEENVSDEKEAFALLRDKIEQYSKEERRNYKQIEKVLLEMGCKIIRPEKGSKYDENSMECYDNELENETLIVEEVLEPGYSHYHGGNTDIIKKCIVKVKPGEPNGKQNAGTEVH